MRIATWNVNSLRVRLEQLKQWLAEATPDVMVLQETKVPDEAFPKADIEALGYRVVFSGQKSYNGVAILARHLPKNVLAGLPGFKDEAKRVLAATFGDCRVINVYVPNGSEVGSEKFHYKLQFLKALKAYLAETLLDHAKVLVLGDFNIAPQDEDVHDPKAWEGSVHVSPEERAALQELLQLGLVDLFRQFDQPSASYSWWDYRAGAYHRNHGLRIDLLLASASLAKTCHTCQIDSRPRAWEQASDHVPVLAEFT